MRIFPFILLIWVAATDLQAATKLLNLKQPAASPATVRLKKAIDRVIVPHRFKHLQAGIVVASLDKNELLYARSANTPLIPASVNKILTAYSVLKKIKPTSHFKTRLMVTDPIKDGVLEGNLYIKGGGDPSLVSERMWMLVNDFMRWKIKKIRGNIVGDATYFDKERRPSTRPQYLRDQAYNAPIGALSFNFNTATIFVRPGEKPNVASSVYVDPENSYVDIVNQAKTSKKGSRYSINVSRLKHLRGDLGDTVLIRGKIPVDHKEVRYFRNIVNPTLYTCHMLKTFLERRGVEINGTIKEGTVPKEAKEMVVFDSLPMWHIVWGMNKFSNNFVADQLLKKLGAEIWGAPGNIQKGLTAIKDALEDIGIPKKSYHIADGSGLTRKSKITARQVVRVLRAGYHDFSIRPEFMASLGVAGEDGTLRRRFASSKSLIRAKTGSLDGVAALAGFTPSSEGELLVFAIILNDPKLRYGGMTGWVDRIAMAIRQFRRN